MSTRRKNLAAGRASATSHAYKIFSASNAKNVVSFVGNTSDNCERHKVMSLRFGPIGLFIQHAVPRCLITVVPVSLFNGSLLPIYTMTL